MDFGYVIKRAWEIIWKFKVLWIFGILASCGQASGSSGSNSGFRFSSQDIPFVNRAQQYYYQINPAIIGLLIVVFIIFVLLLIVLAILLGTIGRVGLIRGTYKAEEGATRLTFSELWHDGLTYFWRVFGLNLLIWVFFIVIGFALLIIGITLTVGTLGIFLICLIPLLCLLAPLFWLISIIIEQANVALVVENVGIMAGIKRGWQVFIDNIGSMIVMGLILLIGVAVIGGVIIGLPLLAIAAPATIGITTGVTENIRNGFIVSTLLFLLYLPVLIFLSGMIRAYTTSAWTLTYLRLTRKPAQPAPVLPEDPGQR